MQKPDEKHVSEGSPSIGIDKVISYWSRNPVHSVEFASNGDLKKYLQEIDALRWSDNERWAREEFYEFSGFPPGRILDAGCGIGVFTRYYARKGFAVHAIDITRQAVDITRRGLEAFGLRGEVLQGSVECLPFPDNTFDYLVSNGVIHHTVGTEKAAREFFRVLKPGGIASVCIYYRNILLRKPLWSLLRLLLPFFLKKRDGRENLLTAQTPEEFVHTYDGNDTPIAKLYSRKQADRVFAGFEFLRVEPHYFPARFLSFIKVGGLLHRILDRSCGVLIYYLMRKPSTSGIA